jgi:hypothetical protein
MICTFVNAPIIPNGAPAVEGSPRTFNCVDVVPSTGAAVGGSVGGAGVSDAGGGMVGGKVEVMKGAGLGTGGFSPHPETSSAIVVTHGRMILCTRQL